MSSSKVREYNPPPQYLLAFPGGTSMSRNRISSAVVARLVERRRVCHRAVAARRCARVVRHGVIATVAAQDPVTPPPQEPRIRAAGRGGPAVAARRRRRGRTRRSSPAPIKTDDGVFKVHRGMLDRHGLGAASRFPTKELDKDFVWNVSIKKTTIGAGFGGQSVSSRVGALGEARRPHPAARTWTTASRRTPTNWWRGAVADANYPAIIRDAAGAGYGAERRSGRRRHDASSWTASPEFCGARRDRRPRRWTPTVRSSRRAVSFPENVNVEATLTFTGGAADAARRRWWRRRRRRATRHARAERHGARAPQPDEAAGEGR